MKPWDQVYLCMVTYKDGSLNYHKCDSCRGGIDVNGLDAGLVDSILLEPQIGTPDHIRRVEVPIPDGARPVFNRIVAGDTANGITGRVFRIGWRFGQIRYLYGLVENTGKLIFEID